MPKLLYILIPIAALLFFVVTPIATASTYQVGAGQPYEKIQDAINAASPGDTIMVFSGTYQENLLVNKTLTIIGINNGGGLPLLNGSGSDQDAIRITADGVILNGFNITDTYCSLLYRWGDSSYGGYGYKQSICVNLSSNHNQICGNTINGYNGIFIADNTTGNSVANNTITNAELGILISNSSDNEIIGNIVNTTSCGLDLYSSINNTVIENDFGSGSVVLYSSSYNRILKNTMGQISIQDISALNTVSRSNVIWLNTLTRRELGTQRKNFWNSTVPVEYTYQGRTYTNYTGNYWRYYKGQDANGDGIGDTPAYDRDSDYYPMLLPVNIPVTATTTAIPSPQPPTPTPFPGIEGIFAIGLGIFLLIRGRKMD